MAEVKAKDVSVAFGAVKVIENLNLDIGEGEFVVLLGSSGCGKSTLLNCIAGLQEIAEGEIWIGDDVMGGGPTTVPWLTSTSRTRNTIELGGTDQVWLNWNCPWLL